ncbi:hypothetical protein DPEC_G00358770 [Dallia pectoralis]|uniref:Uncharacterized protein n=1 Tax=Dallia pectoralis TaxID=75939 RepID=A0ACC2F0A8_DALPE|nr:hypothetical protein DPEC_G00358770 [Dallia pectoralis]
MPPRPSLLPMLGRRSGRLSVSPRSLLRLSSASPSPATRGKRLRCRAQGLVPFLARFSTPTGSLAVYVDKAARPRPGRDQRVGRRIDRYSPSHTSSTLWYRRRFTGFLQSPLP